MNRTELFCKVLKATGLLGVMGYRAKTHRSKTVTILAYHRVLNELPGPEFVFDEGVVSCTAAAFERDMLFIREHFDVISFADLEADVFKQARNPLIITFDDGYIDAHDVILPILLEHGLKASFFVSTGYVESGMIPWWDEISYLTKRYARRQIYLKSLAKTVFPTSNGEQKLRAVDTMLSRAKKVKDEQRLALLAELRELCGPVPSETGRGLFMNWDQIKDLASKGMEIGSHSVSHPILSQITSPENLEFELVESKRVLEEQIGKTVSSFCYPVGGPKTASEQVARAIAAAGYRYACLYEHGVNGRALPDPYNLWRISAETANDYDRFRAKLLFPGLVRY